MNTKTSKSARSGRRVLVPVSGQVSGEEEIKNIISASMSENWAYGAYNVEFANKLKEYVGTRYAVLCNSGSSADLLALASLKSNLVENESYQLKDGDYIITTALSFPTTVNAIIQNNLVPIFVDSDIDTLNANPDRVQEALWHFKSKKAWKNFAILLTHTLGNPFDFDNIDNMRYPIIEDNCDALGSEYKGKKTGSLGMLSTLSFYPAHHITTGEGGAVLTNKPKLFRAIESMSSWGKSCFPAGTPITTSIGIKNIEDIVPWNDFVISHDGKSHLVTHTFNRKYSGKLFKIKARNRPEIHVTGEHPFLVLEGKDKLIWKLAKNLQINDCLVEAIPEVSNLDTNFRWTYKTQKEIKEFTLEVHPDLLRLIGYWLSQGNLASGLKGSSGYKENKHLYYRVDFSFNSNKPEIIEDIKIQMKKFFGCPSGYQRKSKNAITISFKSRKAHSFFERFCGVGAFNKHIPYHLINFCNPKLLINLVWGEFLGDEHRSFQGYTLSSISYELIEQSRRILLENGILASANVRTKDKHHSSIVNGNKIIQKHDLWTINLYGKNAERFSDLCEDDFKAKSNRQVSWIDKSLGIAKYKIYRIETEDVVDLDVYNLEVYKAHSYHAWGIAVHNCWCAPGFDNTCGKRFGWQLGKLPYGYDHKYIFSDIGYNLKMTNLQAAIGVAQMEKINSFVQKRRENWNYLYRHLCSYEDYFIFQKALPDTNPSWFGFAITLRENLPFTKNELVNFLESKGIATRPIFAGNITKQPAYQKVHYEVFGDLKTSDYVMNNSFWIGVFPGLEIDQLGYVVEAFDKFIGEKC